MTDLRPFARPPADEIYRSLETAHRARRVDLNDDVLVRLASETWFGSERVLARRLIRTLREDVLRLQTDAAFLRDYSSRNAEWIEDRVAEALDTMPEPFRFQLALAVGPTTSVAFTTLAADSYLGAAPEAIRALQTKETSVAREGRLDPDLPKAAKCGVILLAAAGLICAGYPQASVGMIGPLLTIGCLDIPKWRPRQPVETQNLDWEDRYRRIEKLFDLREKGALSEFDYHKELQEILHGHEREREKH
jgi:hypothetical protein